MSTSKGLNTLFCKEKGASKNQTLATKKYSYLLLLLLKKLERRWGNSPTPATHWYAEAIWWVTTAADEAKGAQMGRYGNHTAQYSFKFPQEFDDF